MVRRRGRPSAARCFAASILALAALNCGVSAAIAGERCGPTTCSGDERCCNATCGLCAPANGACIQPDCGWGSNRVGGRRPMLAIDQPSALMGPWIAAEGGVGSTSDAGTVANSISGGQLLVGAMVPIGARFRARSALRLDLASFDVGSAPSQGSSFGVDGHLQAEVGVAWSVPLSRSWLHAALLLDAVVSSRRTFEVPAGTLAQHRTWADPMLRAAPGLAVAVGFGWWSATAFGRYLTPGPDSDSFTGRIGRHGLEAGVSVDSDLAAMGVPFGVMLQASTWVFAKDQRAEGVGMTLYWLYKSFRVALCGRMVIYDGPVSLEWPATELNLRLDWMPATH